LAAGDCVCGTALQLPATSYQLPATKTYVHRYHCIPYDWDSLLSERSKPGCPRTIFRKTYTVRIWTQCRWFGETLQVNVKYVLFKETLPNGSVSCPSNCQI
jgi:hypothetical protein